MKRLAAKPGLCKISLASLGLLIAASSALPVPAFANEVVLHKAYISTMPAPCRLAGAEVFSITRPAGGFTAEERTTIVDRNLNNALMGTRDRSPAAVEIVMINSLPVIRLGGKHIVTIDSELAAANNTSMDALAETWANNLRQVLSNNVKVDNYVAQMSGDFLIEPWSPPARREQWQAARMNHAAESYRKDMPVVAYNSKSLKNDGFDLLKSREPQAAEAFFRAALNENSENERARYGLGLSLLKQGRLEPALTNLEIARYLEPDDAQVHIAIGQALEAQGRDTEAIESFQKASLLQPENPEAALYVADLREERDQISKSTIELSQAQMNCPDSEYIRLRKKDQVAWRLFRPY